MRYELAASPGRFEKEAFLSVPSKSRPGDVLAYVADADEEATESLRGLGRLLLKREQALGAGSLKKGRYER